MKELLSSRLEIDLISLENMQYLLRNSSFVCPEGMNHKDVGGHELRSSLGSLYPLSFSLLLLLLLSLGLPVLFRLLLFVLVHIQRLRLVIPDRFHDSQAFRVALPEQNLLTDAQVLRSLHEPKGDGCTIAGADEWTIDVDNGARLTYRTDVKHSLVFLFDSGGVA